MKSLPFGIPKLIVCPGVVPAYVREWFDVMDMVTMQSVVDFAGLNELVKNILVRAAGAICGMVENSEEAISRLPQKSVAITQFGFSDKCVRLVRQHLEEKGYHVYPFHAQGIGDRAMDGMIRRGIFSGVIDVVTRGIGEEMFDGNCAAGMDRILAASESGIPQVITPSGLDMLSYGRRKDFAELVKSRCHVVIDDMRIEVRTTPEELKKIARVIAERLNKATAPFKVLIPVKGWSSLDMEGCALYDPHADAVFAEELRERLNKKEAIEEVNLHLCAPEFAGKLVDEFVRVFEDTQPN